MGHTKMPRKEEWEEVARMLQELGMARAGYCCREVAAAGLTPDDVRRAIAVYRARRGANGVGALYFRLLNALPNDDFQRAWPAPLKEPHKPAAPEEPNRTPVNPELAALIDSCKSSREALRVIEARNGSRRNDYGSERFRGDAVGNDAHAGY